MASSLSRGVRSYSFRYQKSWFRCTGCLDFCSVADGRAVRLPQKRTVCSQIRTDPADYSPVLWSAQNSAKWTVAAFSLLIVWWLELSPALLPLGVPVLSLIQIGLSCLPQNFLLQKKENLPDDRRSNCWPWGEFSHLKHINRFDTLKDHQSLVDSPSAFERPHSLARSKATITNESSAPNWCGTFDVWTLLMQWSRLTLG